MMAIWFLLNSDAASPVFEKKNCNFSTCHTKFLISDEVINVGRKSQRLSITKFFSFHFAPTAPGEPQPYLDITADWNRYFLNISISPDVPITFPIFLNPCTEDGKSKGHQDYFDSLDCQTLGTAKALLSFYSEIELKNCNFPQFSLSSSLLSLT